MSRFNSIDLVPPSIDIFDLRSNYQVDPDVNKVDLTFGVYKTEDEIPWVLPVVRQAELQIAKDETLNHDYLHVLGMEEFIKNAIDLILGHGNPAILNNRTFGVQVLSSSGGLRVGAEFLAKVLKYSVFYIPKPTWSNHKITFLNAGFKECKEYRYWSEQKRNLDISGLLNDLRTAPENAVVLLHACCQNPTGCDPTEEEWEQIADVMLERNLFPFFDLTYQGLASGDLDKDAWPIRYFVQRNFELLCTQSFSKNFCLYNERVGCLIFVVQSYESIPPIKSQLKYIIRGNYSNPPNHGARIVTFILSNPQLREEWKGCIKIMTKRIKKMRESFYQELKRLGTPGTWEHIITQTGMFAYTGLNTIESENMTSKYHVYMPRNGRICISGLTMRNIKYVASAIHETVIDMPR